MLTSEASMGRGVIGATSAAKVESTTLELATDPKSGVVNPELHFALELVARKADVFQPKFLKWLSLNWNLWLAFEMQADVIWGMGRRHYSARTIIEFLRHQSTLREVQADEGPSGAPLKINNSYVPDIGRLYGLLNPSRSGFFECRELHKTTTRHVIRGAAAGPDDVHCAA